MANEALTSLAPAEHPPVVEESSNGNAVDTNDIDLLLPPPEDVTLATGDVVVVKPLRTREFFALFRILTRGAAPQLSSLRLNLENQEEFAAQLIALLLFAFPEAEEETISFLAMMVEPKGLQPNNSDANRKFNDQQRQALAEQFDNPDPSDVIEIISAVVNRESSNLQALGKRVRQMWTLAQRVGEVPKS
jgi:hypothetical protein